MKKLLLVLTVLATALSASVFAQTAPIKAEPKYDEQLAKKTGADEYGMRSYVFVLLKTGKTNITDEKKRGEVFAGHFANMKRLAEEGKLVLAGPYSDPDNIKRGLFIFSVETLDEAKALVDTDPAVKAGVFDYELTKWYGSAALMLTGEMHKKVQKSVF